MNKFQLMETAHYVNGNYNVILMPNGTKIRYNDEDSLIPAFPENIDIKITNRCEMGCPMCHECSTADGEEADIESLLKFCDTLHPYTELAIGGGDPLSYTHIKKFLKALKSNRIVPNITINGNQVEKYNKLLWDLHEYYGLKGIGISLNSGDFRKIIESSRSIPNVVYHVIAGMLTDEQINTLLEYDDIKVLILGYKTKGRGKEYISDKSSQSRVLSNIENLRNRLEELVSTLYLVSFDNLAIKQLNIKEWAESHNIKFDDFYMGDDGDFTMYVDAVNMEYAVSSTNEKRYKIGLTDTVDTIFEAIRSMRYEV